MPSFARVRPAIDCPKFFGTKGPSSSDRAALTHAPRLCVLLGEGVGGEGMVLWNIFPPAHDCCLCRCLFPSAAWAGNLSSLIVCWGILLRQPWTPALSFEEATCTASYSEPIKCCGPKIICGVKQRTNLKRDGYGDVSRYVISHEGRISECKDSESLQPHFGVCTAAAGRT